MRLSLPDVLEAVGTLSCLTSIDSWFVVSRIEVNHNGQALDRTRRTLNCRDHHHHHHHTLTNPPTPFEGARVQRERITTPDVEAHGATLNWLECNAIKYGERPQAVRSMSQQARSKPQGNTIESNGECITTRGGRFESQMGRPRPERSNHDEVVISPQLRRTQTPRCESQ